MNRTEILLKNTIDLLKEQLINNAEDIYIGGHYISPEEYFYNILKDEIGLTEEEIKKLKL